ncbi:PLC-like phosphodiesterase [Kalaharituber pfeilii]|nr:PLC-like phosphodiesterase [Kalaharituber pfeilii]
MLPPNLTIRNISPHPLTITHLERFPIPVLPSTPLTNFTTFLNKTPLKNTPISTLLPSSTPGNAKLAENAQAFQSQDVSIKINPFQTLNSEVKLSETNTGGEILRVTFTCSSGDDTTRFRVEVNPFSKDFARQVVSLTPTPPHTYSAVWHISHFHLTLFSTPPLDKWQASLPDSLPLSALSIPGSHNAPTYHVAAPSVRCQHHSVPTQLQNGIRFLDIRAQPEQSAGDMWLVHGAFPVSLRGKEWLSKVLSAVYKFLEQNPRETVMVSLKREGPINCTDEAFSKLLHDKLVKPNEGRWYTDSRVPRLGEARGKCVLLRRFKLAEELKGLNSGRGWGIDAERWADNTPNHTTRSGNIVVQDFYEVLAPANIDTKIKYVKEHIARASAVTHSHSATEVKPVYINFLSASNFWNVTCWPEGIAEKVNPAVGEYLAREHDLEKGDGGSGVVVGDFVGEGGVWEGTRLVVALNGVVEMKVRERERREKEEREKRERAEKARKEKEARDAKEREEKARKEKEAKEKEQNDHPLKN